MRKIVTSSLALLFVTAVSLGTAGPVGAATRAVAAPTDPWFGTCSHFVDYQARYITGYCDGGGDAKFYVYITCKSPIWPWPYTNFGEVELAGGGVSSHTSCNNKVVDAGLVKLPEQ